MRDGTSGLTSHRPSSSTLLLPAGPTGSGTCMARLPTCLSPQPTSPCLDRVGHSDGAAIHHEKQTTGCGNRNSFLFPPALSGHVGAGRAEHWGSEQSCRAAQGGSGSVAGQGHLLTSGPAKNAACCQALGKALLLSTA